MVEPNSLIPLLGEDELTLFDVYCLRIFLGRVGWTNFHIPQELLLRDQLRQEERKKLVDKIETQTEREVEGRHKETFEV